MVLPCVVACGATYVLIRIQTKTLHPFSFSLSLSPMGLHQSECTRPLDQGSIFYFYFYINSLNFWAMDERVRSIGLTWNLLSGVVPHGSFQHPPLVSLQLQSLVSELQRTFFNLINLIALKWLLHIICCFRWRMLSPNFVKPSRLMVCSLST